MPFLRITHFYWIITLELETADEPEEDNELVCIFFKKRSQSMQIF